MSSDIEVPHEKIPKKRKLQLRNNSRNKSEFRALADGDLRPKVADRERNRLAEETIGWISHELKGTKLNRALLAAKA